MAVPERIKQYNCKVDRKQCRNQKISLLDSIFNLDGPRKHTTKTDTGFHTVMEGPQNLKSGGQPNSERIF